MRVARLPLAVTALVAGGCNIIFGVAELRYTGSSSGAGAAPASSGPSGGGGDGAANTACTPSATQDCYDGPAGSDGVGVCHGGEQTCAADGSGFGGCTGQVLPSEEDCASAVDDNCRGNAPDCGAHLWSKRWGDADFQQGIAAAADDGNVVVAGTFSGQIDFGDGVHTANGYDVFVVKLDADGNVLWSNQFGGNGGQYVQGVAVGDAGNIVVTGQFDGQLDFGGGLLPFGGTVDGFVAKLDPSGDHVWSHSLGGLGEQRAFGVAVDEDGGDVYVGGYASSDVKLDGGATLVPGTGEDDGFVVRFDLDGNLDWSRGIDGSLGVRVHGIAVDPTGGCVVTGYGGGTIDFAVATVTGSTTDLLVAAIDDNGFFRFGRLFGGNTMLQQGYGVAVDANGAAIVTGFFEDKIDFGDGEVSSAGEFDLFVLALDDGGDLGWARTFGGTGTEIGYGVALDVMGNALLTGSLEKSVDFGGGLLAVTNGAVLAFKLDPLGEHAWSRAFSGGDGAVGYSIASTSDGALVITGKANADIDFGGGVLPGTSDDVFLARLAP